VETHGGQVSAEPLRRGVCLRFRLGPEVSRAEGQASGMSYR
jgi:hypothetical protein